MGMDRQIEPKSWIRKKLKYVLMGTFVTGLIVYFIAFSDHSSKFNAETNKITIAEVTEDLFLDFISVIGTVEPKQTIYLDATEGGRVEAIVIEEGNMVKEGDVILELSNDNLLLEISNNEAQVAQAVNDVKTLQVNLENQNINNQTQLLDLYYDLLKLEREYNYNQTLFKDAHISKEELTLSSENFARNKKRYELLKKKAFQDSLFMESRLVVSEKSVQSMQDNLVIIRNRLNKLMVRSPVDGELASLNPKVGEVINYGQRLGTVNILDSYKLKVEIDEHYISRVQRNLAGEGDFANVSYLLKITKVYPEVVQGRFVVDMEFFNGTPKDIRIGQTSRIRLELGEAQKAMMIPRGGFYQNTGGQWIFVVDPSGKKAVKRNIKIGRQNPRFYEVIEGLQPGERVIVSGYESFGTADVLILN